jgi:hypothetical protein
MLGYSPSITRESADREILVVINYSSGICIGSTEFEGLIYSLTINELIEAITLNLELSNN